MVRSKWHISFLVGCLFVLPQINAQDIHFSMFDMSPLTLNPANTGLMDGDRRISNIYRTQWKAIGDPLNTYAIGYDQQLYFLPYNMSGGLLFVSDKSGGIDLVENKFLLSASTKIYRGRNTFSFGLQGGIVSKTWSWKGATFPSQYNREVGGFDQRLPNGETGYEMSRVYGDINAGVILKRITSKGVMVMGASAFHVNSPDDSFFKNGKGLKPRLAGHINYDMQLNERWFIKPSYMVMTMQKAQDMLFNVSGGMILKDAPMNIQRLWLGAGVRTGINRNGDAVYPSVGADFKHLNVAMAYDVNFSDLQVATNNRGAFEIALIYTSRSTAANKVIIPCDRY